MIIYRDILRSQRKRGCKELEMVRVVFNGAHVFVIVTVHEWGHYYFARRAGILVREFAIDLVQSCSHINAMKRSLRYVFFHSADTPVWPGKIRNLSRFSPVRRLRFD